MYKLVSSRKNAVVAVTAVVVFGLAVSANAAITGQNGYTATAYFANPHAGEALVSFDWSSTGNLFYSTRSPVWNPQFAVYEYDGDSSTNIYSDPSAYAGSRVTRIGDRMYFNDGGNDSRYTFDYYRYDPTVGGSPVKVIDSSAANGSECWGLATRNGSDIWAGGGWPTVIRYSNLDAQGDLVTEPMTDLGVIGAPSGPLAFDSIGNLYYAQGWGDTIYRFTAAEVAAAIADSSTNPLSPTGHEWATIGGDATGATGIFVTDDWGLVLTATSLTAPSELRRYAINPDGTSAGYEVMATSPSVMTETRYYDGTIYVADADGISGVPEPVTMALLATGGVALLRRGSTGLARARSRQAK